MNDKLNAPPRMTPLEHGTEVGIDWATVRAPLYGAVNGYVRIPEGHPWHGLGYDDIDVEVHGGLTYANDGWVGFDTLHGGDCWPGSPRYHREDEWAHHWTEAEVVEETRALARRVAEAVSA